MRVSGAWLHEMRSPSKHAMQALAEHWQGCMCKDMSAKASGLYQLHLQFWLCSSVTDAIPTGIAWTHSATTKHNPAGTFSSSAVICSSSPSIRCLLC